MHFPSILNSIPDLFERDGNSTFEDDHYCKLILYVEIKNTGIRIWDIIILIPNLIFFIFLLLRFNRARLKLRATSSPIFLAFYGLVFVNVIVSVIRCLVSMFINGHISGVIDKIFWVIVRFFLMATEMSVVTFGMAFGHLDSQSSIKYVLIVTSTISLAYTVAQGILEVVLPDDSFHIKSKDLDLYGHGGMRFWFSTSVLFTLVYLTIFVLPRTKLRERLALPRLNRSFYNYIFFLFLLNLIQSIGTGMMNYGFVDGLCLVDFTTWLYFSLLPPLVYITFLSELLGVTQPIINFSYKPQVDDAIEDDQVSLPHQQSLSSLKTDSDYIYQNPNTMTTYDSTQFNLGGNTTPMNPLYAVSLQSPDSITGYSITSSQSMEPVLGGGNLKGYQTNYSIQNN